MNLPADINCAAPALEDCAVIELRDYTLHPGGREVLIELFEREFVETQEAVGMRVVATFRDLDRPDHFVWLRGFAGMPQRRRGLEAFYGGPTWQTRRNAANATMIDASDVRLLRYAKPAWALASPLAPRPRTGSDERAPRSLYALTRCTLPAPPDAALLRHFERLALPALRDAGAMPCAVFVTETAENDFPRLPVRTDGAVLAWMSRLPDATAWQPAEARLLATAGWADFLKALRRHSAAPPATWRLQPTARSLLR